MDVPTRNRPTSPIYELPEPVRSSYGAGPLEWTGLAAVAFVAVAADQITKSLATRQLELQVPHPILPGFDLERIRNTGIAFGQFTGQQAIVSVLTGAAIVWMVVFFARAGSRHIVFPVAFGLLIGGASSNLADRLRAGSVTDFLHIHHWPIFNLADTFIVVGVGLLLLGLSRHERRARAAS